MYINTLCYFLEREFVQENQTRKVCFDNVPTYFYYHPEEPASPRNGTESLVRKRNDPARYQRGEDDRFGSFNNHCANLYITNIGH